MATEETMSFTITENVLGTPVLCSGETFVEAAENASDLRSIHWRAFSKLYGTYWVERWSLFSEEVEHEGKKFTARQIRATLKHRETGEFLSARLKLGITDRGKAGVYVNENKSWERWDFETKTEYALTESGWVASGGAPVAVIDDGLPF